MKAKDVMTTEGINVPGIGKVIDRRTTLPTMGELVFGARETA